MAVVFDQPTVDNATVAGASNVITLTTPAVTISSSANRAGVLGLSVDVNSISGITGNIGGVSGALITGTDSGTTVVARAMQFSVIAPPSGSQTGRMDWTTNTNCTLAFATATGVDQTTPLIHGTFATGASGNLSLSITSANGNLTIDTAGIATDTLSSPNQTEKWNNSASFYGGGSIGPGTGTTTHTWSSTGAASWAQSGSDFLAASAATPDPISSANITSSAGRFIGWTT